MTHSNISVEPIDDQTSRVKINLDFVIIKDNEEELREDVKILTDKFNFNS